MDDKWWRDVLHDLINRDELLTQVGGDMNVIYLARHMIEGGALRKVANTWRAYVRR